MLLNQILEELKNKIDMLKNKVFCQEVELSELKDTHNKKVNSCNFEKENLEAEYNNRDNLSKVYLKLKNELEIASKELQSLQSETIASKETMEKKNRETKKNQKTNIAKEFSRKYLN